MNSLIDRCAEIKAKAARKRAMIGPPSDGHNLVSSRDNQAVAGTKGKQE